MVETRVQRIIYQDQAAALITVQDITEHKQLEAGKGKICQGTSGEEHRTWAVHLYRFSRPEEPLVTIKTFLGYLEQDIAGFWYRRIEKDKLFMNNAGRQDGKLTGRTAGMSPRRAHC